MNYISLLPSLFSFWWYGRCYSFVAVERELASYLTKRVVYNPLQTRLTQEEWEEEKERRVGCDFQIPFRSGDTEARSDFFAHLMLRQQTKKGWCLYFEYFRIILFYSGNLCVWPFWDRQPSQNPYCLRLSVILPGYLRVETRSCKKRKTSSIGVWLTPPHSSNGPTIIGLPQYYVRTTHIIIRARASQKQPLFPHICSAAVVILRKGKRLFFSRASSLTSLSRVIGGSLLSPLINKSRFPLFSAPVSLPLSPPPFST